MKYYQQYLKYKQKYINLKKVGGSSICPENIYDYLENKFDAGTYGDLYTIKGEPNLVAKVIKLTPNADNKENRLMNRDHFIQEVKMTQHFANFGLGVPMKCAGFFSNNGQEYGYIIQQKLLTNALNLLHATKNKQVGKNQFEAANLSIQSLFTQMKTNNVYNHDLSLKNIMFNSDFSKAYMIDSSEGTITPTPEISATFDRVKKQWNTSYNFILAKIK